MVAEACTFVGAAAFLLAGLAKLRHISLFAEQVADYGILPYRSTRVAAVTVIVLELAVCTMALTPVTHTDGLVLGSLVLLLFTAAQVSALVRKLSISCGCFGRSPERDSLDRIGPASLARNASLMVAAGVGLSSTPHYAAGALVGALAIVPLVLTACALCQETARLLFVLEPWRRRNAKVLTNGGTLT